MAKVQLNFLILRLVRGNAGNARWRAKANAQAELKAEGQRRMRRLLTLGGRVTMYEIMPAVWLTLKIVWPIEK